MLITDFAEHHIEGVKPDSNNMVYKIGAVSRITGIGSETLRAWERRYKAVIPNRSESGDRQYSREDVTKLLMLKTLTESGISIGTIASLGSEELQSLFEEHSKHQDKYANGAQKIQTTSDIDSNVALLGDSFPVRILDGLEEVKGINLVGMYESINELQDTMDSSKQINIVVVETPTINSKTKKQMSKIIEISGAWHIVVIYGFANQEQIEDLQSSQVTVVRSAVDVQELARLCIVHSGGSERLPGLQTGSTLHYEQTIPSRKFSNKQLTQLAAISSTIKCECPKHMSDIVKDLVSFEIYSAECENENDQDAALHSYLHATTAQARSMLEEAMSHLIRVEGIDLNQ
ncbi:MAG: MerR family transcriptional regulator [Gammaproteobacteria bacterium]